MSTAAKVWGGSCEADLPKRVTLTPLAGAGCLTVAVLLVNDYLSERCRYCRWTTWQYKHEAQDVIYASGPLSREQLADSLKIELETVASVVEHEWFEILDAKARQGMESCKTGP